MSGGVLLACFGYYYGAGLAINLGYHRSLSHRSLVLNKQFERFVVTLGLPAGTPIQWASNHRFHHVNADRALDPHSPLDGFWHAHNGWYIGRKDALTCIVYALAGPLRVLFDGWHRPRTNQQFVHLAPDVSSDPYYRFVSRPGVYMVCAVLHVALFFGGMWWWAGLSGLLSLWATLVIVFNLGDAIDSMAHLVGELPYAGPDRARNHWFLGVLTLGEGWHANHHRFPWSARHGLLAHEFDGIWLTIRALCWLGLAKNPRVPSERAVLEAKSHSEVSHATL
jgi:fatty-acid desaturase